MNKQVVVADCNLSVRENIIKSIKWGELGLILAGEARDSEELLRLIESVAADIIILDIQDFDCLEIIGRARRNFSGCQFIITSARRRFEYAHNALKWQAAAFLLKPVDDEEINSALALAAKNAALSYSRSLPDDGINIAGHLFFELARNEFTLKPMTFERVNTLMETRFKKGDFRVCHVKFDFFGDTMPCLDSVMQMQNRCMEIIRTEVYPYCHDIIFNSAPLFSRFLINCSPDMEREINDALEHCLIKMKALLPECGSSDITIGMSLPFSNLSNLYIAMSEAGEAIWLRFSQGAGRIIYWEKGQELPKYYKNKFEMYEQNLKKACALLDIDDFVENINQFFSLSSSILIYKETRSLILRVERYMYDVNRDLIALFSDADQINRIIRDSQRRASTLEEYKNSYVLNMTALFKDISSHAPKHSKAVLQAQYYVSENINKDLSLHVVSGQIGLSPVYFSALFKKKTGENFTDYVNSKRIEAAKKLLVQRNVKIGQVSDLTGFSNSKYFSKLFRKSEGLTPSEYRKKHME